MTPFLKQVALTYLKHEREILPECCFIFPNKRSATFFNRFMQEAIGRQPVLMPETTNITDFVSSFSPLHEANRYDLLFTLFDQYRKLPNVEVDFDQFVFWGEMLLADFNDVDRYLVDPDQLFINIKRLREISANFLTPQQIEVIRRYWGEDRTNEAARRFWNHIDQNADRQQYQKFVKLWEILQPLYNNFRADLASRGLASSGMLYRNATETLSPANHSLQLPYKRYIFVGFNVLSTSEIKIFSSLRNRQIADFYWDCNSPAMTADESRAARFIRRNIKEFPSRHPLDEFPITTMPQINIIGVPSNIGQVKIAGHTVSQWVKDKIISDPANAIDTAIVLPDESLFIPLIHSIPDIVSTINVTMGFPMKLSPMSSLIRSVISLQLRSRIRNGQRIFFHQDVAALLSLPALRENDSKACAKLENIIRRDRLFTIPADTITNTIPSLAPIFASITDFADRHAIHRYITSLCDFLQKLDTQSDKIQHHFIDSYRRAADDLFDAADRYDISMKGEAFFRLIERAIGSDTVRFVGEPLRGLQMMGVLETRALDFKNIIMLSMNERVFPRKHYSRSFIPDALRHAYGMATIDFQESIFAYYFYRLISRAENVTLIYDARAVGGSKSNEISRYLAQLLYLYNSTGNIKHHLKIYDAQRFEPEKIVISKTPEIIEKINQYRAGGSKTLSASAINTYINCPLNFYLQYVEGLNADAEITDYIDFSTYGTIVHDVVQHIYESFQNENHDPVTITQSMIQPIIRHDNPTLDREITRAINIKFNRLPDNLALQPLLGESLILSRVIRSALTAMFKTDIALCPFTFVAAEKKMQGTLKINPNLEVNFKQIIDRIDITADGMRFVDYKTGSDPLSASSVDLLFDRTSSNRPKAIMQLILYCYFYNYHNHTDHQIRPLIYKFIDIPSKGVTPLKVNKKQIDDYREILPQFLDRFNATIEELFNPDQPFVQSENTHSCTFCDFRQLCQRDEEKPF